MPCHANAMPFLALPRLALPCLTMPHSACEYNTVQYSTLHDKSQQRSTKQGPFHSTPSTIRDICFSYLCSLYGLLGMRSLVSPFLSHVVIGCITFVRERVRPDSLDTSSLVESVSTPVGSKLTSIETKFACHKFCSTCVLGRCRMARGAVLLLFGFCVGRCSVRSKPRRHFTGGWSIILGLEQDMSSLSVKCCPAPASSHDTETKTFGVSESCWNTTLVCKQVPALQMQMSVLKIVSQAKAGIQHVFKAVFLRRKKLYRSRKGDFRQGSGRRTQMLAEAASEMDRLHGSSESGETAAGITAPNPSETSTHQVGFPLSSEIRKQMSGCTWSLAARQFYTFLFEHSLSECCIGRGRMHQHLAGGRETATPAIATDYVYLNDRDDRPQVGGSVTRREHRETRLSSGSNLEHSHPCDWWLPSLDGADDTRNHSW